MIEIFQSGGPVMYPIALCSVISLTIIIERLIFWLNLHIRQNVQSAEKMLDMVKSGNWKEADDRSNFSGSYLTRILAAGIFNRNQNHSAVKAMKIAAEEEIQKMQKFMAGLDTIITIAPLLGILGTVLGIIESFNMLETTGIETPKAVTGGIAQALITTAAGLSVSIATVFPYNWFNSKIMTAASVMEKYATTLEIACDQEFNNENQHS